MTTEGVIQFSLNHTDCVAFGNAELSQLVIWHQRLQRAGLIGRDPQRYGGYAFGNTSIRIVDNQFLISGTQTGDCTSIGPEHFSLVEHCDFSNNHVQSRGPLKPSSECMTHAAIYTAAPCANTVLHIHSPTIWQQYKESGLATTAAHIPYGTPQMAAAVAETVAAMSPSTHGCIAMLGHEDGVICFAEDVATAGKMILDLFDQATRSEVP